MDDPEIDNSNATGTCPYKPNVQFVTFMQIPFSTLKRCVFGPGFQNYRIQIDNAISLAAVIDISQATQASWSRAQNDFPATRQRASTWAGATSRRSILPLETKQLDRFEAGICVEATEYSGLETLRSEITEFQYIGVGAHRRFINQLMEIPIPKE